MSRPAATVTLTLLVLLAVTGGAVCRAAVQGVDANGQLEDRALQSRFERIASELRCLVCQNETIADSNADLAIDLRQQVREMLVAGKSDDAIFDFMTNRYGEFVRFKPPLELKTLFIWGAPFAMLLLGGVIVFRVVRHRSAMPVDDEPATGP
jgi:cytochrome c-type biogenesis protein CcmH